MVNLPYNRDIPDGPNNPSNDQPKMEVNTNSIDTLINVDHYSFKDNLGGTHRKVAMTNTPTPAIPVGSNFVAYANSLPSPGPAGNGNIPGLYVKNTTYDIPLYAGIPVGTTDGSSSMLGGVIIKWGVVAGLHGGIFQDGDGGTVNFATNLQYAFPNACFSVVMQLGNVGIVSTLNRGDIYVVSATVSTAGFQWRFIQSSLASPTYDFAYWIAMGI